MTTLKSTYKPSPPPPSASSTSLSLPPGWTEHTAPTGHKYYHNASTGISTYTRPAVLPQHPYPPPPPPSFANQGDFIPLSAGPATPFDYTNQYPSSISRQNQNSHYKRRSPPPDRPKSKHLIPNHAPWLLIKTRFGRRFVHNPETRESFWKTPKELLDGLVEFDILEKKAREGGEGKATGANGVEVGERIRGGRDGENENGDGGAKVGNVGGEAHDEINEEEQYDEIIEEEVSDDEPQPSYKRPRLDDPSTQADTVPPVDPADTLTTDFTEDDIAAQLAAMGESYDLDPSDYIRDPMDANPDGPGTSLPLTATEATTLFHDLLSAHSTNPYTTWEALISSPAGESLIADDRYTLLPNMRSRKAAFLAWSERAIASQAAAREREKKRDPRIPYLDLLAEHASPKLYWPEFRKKWRKESSMSTSKISDREREKLYREFVGRLKKREREREDDAWDLLKGVPVGGTWNRDSRAEDVADAVRADVRWAVLGTRAKERIVDEFVRGLPYPEDLEGEESGLVETERAERKEKRRREEALRERQRAVLEQKRRQQRSQREGREQLLLEEEELRRAMNVGREGLKSSIQ